MPRLNIDRLLLFCVVMSGVYVVLYNTSTSGGGGGGGGRGPGGRTTGPHHPRHHHVASGIDMTSSDKEPRPRDVTNNKPPGVCSNDVRVRVMRSTCEERKLDEMTFPNDGNLSMKIAVVDDKRKLFYCLIGKAGSKSWLDYMARLTGKVRRGDEQHYRQDYYLEKVGLKMLRRVPLAEIQAKYADYFKFVVVRHPLQRVISAYYEIIQKMKKYKKPDGSLLGMREYLHKVSGELMDYNPHWRRYINRCKICRLQYDYVIKTETMNDDIPDFNDVIGAPKSLGVYHMHSNEQLGGGEEEDLEEGEERDREHIYKYDVILSDMQRRFPEGMKRLLDVYGDDMKVFGYQWDWKRRRSSCQISRNGTGCC